MAHAVMFSSVEYAHYLSKSSIPLEVDAHSLKPHPVFCVPLLLSMGHSSSVILLKPIKTDAGCTVARRHTSVHNRSFSASDASRAFCAALFYGNKHEVSILGSPV